MTLSLLGCRKSGQDAAGPNQAPARTPEVNAVAAKAGPDEISLLDGRTLGQWKITDFGGQGRVYVKDGALTMEMGNDMTGVTWTGPVVPMNYEITLEAMRVSGRDFFCGLTFPVDGNSCSLILGGWGGQVCGLSCINGGDAANNNTTQFVDFQNGKWYSVRLRVTPGQIQAWLDGEVLVDADVTNTDIFVRLEVDLSRPLGIATWQTTGAVRNVKLKRLPKG